MLLQYIYTPILNFLYRRFTSKIDEKYRNFIIGVCFFVIVFIQFLCLYKSFGIITVQVRDLVIALCMLTIIVLSVKNELRPIRYRLSIYLPYVLFACFVLIASFRNELGYSYIVFVIAMLALFLAIFFVWGNRKDYDVLFTLLTRACMFFTLGVIVISILFCPYFKGEWVHLYGYSIMGINPNGFSKVLLPAIVSGIYLLISSHIKVEKIVSAIVTGAVGYMIFITESRAGILCLTLLMATGIIIALLNCLKTKDRKQFEKIGIFIVLAMVSFATMAFILQKISPLINEPLKDQPKQEQAIYLEEETSEADVPGTYAYIWERGNEIIGDNDFLLRLDYITSTRISIWAVYIDNMTLSGCNEPLLVWGPHNQYIEFSYKTGVFTGIVWLCFTILVGGIALIRCIRTRSSVSLFQLLAFIVFFVVSMLDTGREPFERAFIFMYFVSLAPVFIKETKE